MDCGVLRLDLTVKGNFKLLCEICAFYRAGSPVAFIYVYMFPGETQGLRTFHVSIRDPFLV